MRFHEKALLVWRWFTCAACVAVVSARGAAINATQVSLPAGYPNGMLLVEPRDLKKAIDTSSVLAVDVRAADAYKKGHVPDAVWLDLDRWTNESGKPGGLADAKVWAELVGSLGIRSNIPVLVYDETVTPNAARAWWLLRFVGHPDVRLLNGGLSAWRDSGGTIGSDDVPITTSKFEPKFQSKMLADHEFVQQLIGRAGSCVVDSRSTAEFTGEQAAGPRGGRVPGAKHIEWKQFLDERGRFRPAEEIAKLIAARKIADDQLVVTYCQSGGRASLDAFAFELMGFKDVRNYYRSWAEWSADDKLPVEKGK